MEEAGTTAVSLLDDVVLEIVAGVKDIPALLRCAMACKHWCGLVADHSFLRCCWPDNSFVGFIARERFDERGANWLVPAPRSALGRGIRALSSFVPALPVGAVPLVSRHGLLLVRLDADPTVVQLAVCNLHVSACHMLPPRSSHYFAHGVDKINGYSVLAAADCSPDGHDDLPPPSQSHSSAFFKVVIIGYHKGDRKYRLHTFSSHETSWSVHVDCFKSTALNNPTAGFFGDVVVGRGTAHWIFGNWADYRFYVVNLNIQKENIFLTKLPFPLSCVPTGYYDENHQCLALADDNPVSLLCMKEISPQIEIWGQQGDQKHVGATSEWDCTRMMELKEPGKATRKRDLCLLGEKCGILLVRDSRQRVYTADLETGTMKRVVDWPRGRYIKPSEIVPLEIDWAEIFFSRLGTRKIQISSLGS